MMECIFDGSLLRRLASISVGAIDFISIFSPTYDLESRPISDTSPRETRSGL